MQIASRIKLKIIAKIILFACILTPAIAWLLLKTSLSTPTLSIYTGVYPADQSQLFYQHGEAFSESNSSVVKFNKSTQSFDFPLPSYDYSNLRWDPLEKSGTFDIKSIRLSFMGYRTNVSFENIVPIAEVEETVREKDRIHYIVPEGATDPQIHIHINSLVIEKLRTITTFFVSAILALLIAIWTTSHKSIMEFAQRDHLFIRKIRTHLANEQFSLQEFTKLLGIGVFLNIVPIVNFFLSIDDEAGAFRTDPSIWIADGRWTAFIVEKFIFTQPVMPFVPNLFFYVCLAASYMFILRAYQLRFSWITALAYGVLIAHPIWWFIAEFYSNTPSTGLGILSLSIATYIIMKTGAHDRVGAKKIIPLLGASCFIAIAIGAYQSLVMFYLVAAIGAVIFEFQNKQSTALVGRSIPLKRIMYLIAALIMGLIIYVIINKFAQSFLPSNGAYINSFLRIDDLLADPVGISKAVLNEMWKIYTGSGESYGVTFLGSAAALGLAIFFLMHQKTVKSTIWIAACISALLVAPFLLHFVTGAVYLPLRSMLAVSLVIWIAVVVILQKKGILRGIGVAVTLILLFQMVSVNGQYSASTIMATTHDRLTAEAIYSRIAQLNPDFDRDTVATLDIYGRLPFKSHYPAPLTSTMSASFFDWDDGNLNRMVTYMQLIGFNNVEELDMESRISLTPQFEDMPIWPAKDSVQFKNGIYYIKLSKTPDPVHAKYYKSS
ncbi:MULTISPECIES: glucosyltransferase domain-containing protein [unclassified Pseudomonas]|uniref:glucosyltransferase domain-containing protein n=1 Tax=unclassified Pseudomonas TaxID=196821 RepID=UPI000A1EA5C3|nr:MULTISPECIES: glucosyltransferase domain-containing protein [unclassified Pseudomonas]